MDELTVSSDNPKDQLYEHAYFFDSLPEKVQRVWEEEFGAPIKYQVFHVASWLEKDCGIFSNMKGLCFQRVNDVYYCSTLDYEEHDDKITFTDNNILTNSDEESWVQELVDLVVPLSLK